MKRLISGLIFLLLGGLLGLLIWQRASAGQEGLTENAAPDPSPASSAESAAAAQSPGPAPTEEPAPTPESTPEPTPAPTPEPTPTPVPEARQLTVSVFCRSREYPELSDGSYYTEKEIWPGDTVTVRAEEEIGALYIQWERPPEPWTVSSGGESREQGQHGYVHEYVPLPVPSTEAELHLGEGKDTGITEIYAFSVGVKPAWVQDWEEPWENPEILVVSTHSDDEFIFFGGLIPKYIDEGRRLQMCYIVRHTGDRRHEMLDSLWTAGVTHYPVMTECADIYVDKLSKAREVYGSSYVTNFLVEQLRRFKPQVVVGQAEDGDSGHVVHIFGVECLERAVALAGDPQCHYASYERYGGWDVPKLYLHLYGEPEDMVTLDYDQPLARFGGATGFEVAELAFQQCVTQYNGGRYAIYGADSIHDGRRFGLYRSLVGPDVEKTDLFENIPPED